MQSCGGAIDELMDVKECHLEVYNFYCDCILFINIMTASFSALL